MTRASLLTVIAIAAILTSSVSADQASPPDPAVITNSKELQDSIYTKLRFTSGGACIRLLTRTGVVGCATPTSTQVTGPLLAVAATTSANEIPLGSVALISAEDAGKFLQRCGLETDLQNTLAGVLIQHSLAAFPGWNEAPVAPYAEYAVHEMQRDYTWNPAGLDLMSVSFPFPIYQLDNETSANAVQRAQYNREQTKIGSGSGSGSGGGGGGGGIGGESTAVNVARMELSMEATGNASSCITAKTCYPLGGYSIWAALPSLPPTPHEDPKSEKKLPTLLVIAQIDSTSFFHSLTQAADSPISGLIAMMAAAQVLGSTENDPLVVQSYQKRIIFLAVTGEPWGYMGSRRLLWEMENGNLSVQGLELDSIEGIIEIGQVGRAKQIKKNSTVTTEAEEVSSFAEDEKNSKNTTTIAAATNNSSATAISTFSSPSIYNYQLYGHIEKSGDSGTAAAPLLAALQEVAATNLGVILSSASTTTPGLPPSTSSSFLRQRPEIPVVVIEEFNSEFHNSAYHSQYDTVEGNNNNDTNTNTSKSTTGKVDFSDFQKEERFDQNGISATAIFLATALNSLAQSSTLDNSSSSSSNTTASELPLQINSTAVEETVDQLVGCLAKSSPGMGCSLVNALMTPWNSGPAGHYVGILRTVAQNPSLPDPNVQTYVERFIWNFLAVSTATNITSLSSSASLSPWCSPNNASTACPAGTVCAGWRDIQGSAGSGKCINSTVKFVPSYSTLLECVGCNGTDTDDGTFRWKDVSSGNVSTNGTDATAWAARYGWPDDPVWVESNWPSSTPSLELFLKESSAVDYAVLGAGLATTVASVVVAGAVQFAWNKRMKQD